MKDQKRIKNELKNLINEYHLEKELNVDLIIGWIAEEDEPDAMKANRDYQNKWMKYFIQESDIDKFNDILEIFTAAWNYFPHKSLNGLSPMEMVNK